MPLNPYTREKIENWVSDFCMSDDLRPFAGPVKEIAADVLVQFLAAACEPQGIEPEDVEESNLKQALIGHVARLNLPESVRGDLPALCAALLTYLERAGRLGGGSVLAAYVRALQPAFLESISGKGKPIVRPGSKIGRNDPCPCGSGLKYKKCCMNG
jgi:hypothetical protein